MPELILASTSRYRRELLSRLGLEFRCEAPAVDEARRDGETPIALAQRLAADKAAEVSRRFPDAVVIGSDQVAERDGEPLGKPGDAALAAAQLRAASGRRLRFHTAVCVIDGRSGRRALGCDLTDVDFRRLGDGEIERYLEREQPFDCAGSFKAEGLGISLFERIRNDDPTALIGLPLVLTCSLLRDCGFDLP